MSNREETKKPIYHLDDCPGTIMESLCNCKPETMGRTPSSAATPEHEHEIENEGDGNVYCKSCGTRFAVAPPSPSAQTEALLGEMVEAFSELVRVVDGTLQGYGILEKPMAKAKAALSAYRKEKP